MSPATRTKLIAYVVVAIAGFGLATKAGVPLTRPIVNVLVGAPATAALVMTLFDLYVWRVGPVGAPILHGTWRAVVRSQWLDENGDRVPDLECFLVIKQVSTAVWITLLSPTLSRSVSVASSLERGSAGQYTLAWTYRNEPLVADRMTSPRHMGGAIIEGVTKRRPRSLQGRYWTDRGTAGDLLLADRLPVLYDDYAAASAAFESLPTAPAVDDPSTPRS